MNKVLRDMTLEELWKLFPIILTPYNPEWKIWADEEIESLYGLLAMFSPKVSHIGSTAVPGILAKPIVDILVEVQQESDWNEISNIMETSGYICMSVTENRMSFNKGYTPEGYADKVFHIHIRHIGDNDEVYFRDYIVENADIAKEYETLKLSLLPEYRNNRDGYTEAKTAFVKRITDIAKLRTNKADYPVR